MVLMALCILKWLQCAHACLELKVPFIHNLDVSFLYILVAIWLGHSLFDFVVDRQTHKHANTQAWKQTDIQIIVTAGSKTWWSEKKHFWNSILNLWGVTFMICIGLRFLKAVLALVHNREWQWKWHTMYRLLCSESSPRLCTRQLII